MDTNLIALIDKDIAELKNLETLIKDKDIFYRIINALEACKSSCKDDVIEGYKTNFEKISNDIKSTILKSINENIENEKRHKREVEKLLFICDKYNESNTTEYNDIENNIIAFLEEYYTELNDFELPNEFRYTSLPLCLLDAIYSIGVKYSSTQNVVKRYAETFELDIYRDSDAFISKEKQHTISSLIKNIESITSEIFARDVVKNNQLTSTKSGIRKSEAVLRCARILNKYDIETMQDFNEKVNEELIKEFKSVKGQSSGVSFKYLQMLCGNENLIKPDRHILNFLSQCADRTIYADEAQMIVERVCNVLKDKYPNISNRKIDYMIWDYMRSQG